jgi:protein-S-isoprenylcysteine O-methyltransferase Ste14
LAQDGRVEQGSGDRYRAALQSVLFLLVAPGIVAGLIPWLITGWRGSVPGPWQVAAQVLGWLLVAGGATVLLYAFFLFVVDGLGTPAPIAPTKSLVVTGAYRWVRNPMYLAVTSVIVGQVLLFGSWPLLAYAAVVVLAFVTFVHGYEEPTLRSQFGAEYETYLKTVPGWWPRRPRT